MAKRFLSLVLALFLVLGALPGTALAANKSGKCGQNATWSLDGKGTLTIKGTGKMADFDVDKDENTIPWSAYQDLIRSIVIEKGVTSIGNQAFWNCTNLTSVIIPDSITSIGEASFMICRSLPSVNIPNSVISIDEYAFYGCSSLTDVRIPNGVTSIEYGTFYDCSALTSINIPTSVTSIDTSAFERCSALINVTIPDSVTSIGAFAFRRCSSLTSITISDRVTSLQKDLFGRCDSLTSVTIPVSVTSIEENVFRDCNSLKDIYYSGTKAQWGQVKIENLDKGNDFLYNATIHYNTAPSSGTSKKYTVNFNPNGGAVTTKSKSVTNGSTYGTLPTPTRTGYKFDGWYTSKTGGTKITSATKVTKTMNHTLYAHWSKIRKCPVTFDPNGGTVLTEEQNFITGTRYRHLPTPTRASYHFDGWYTAKTGGAKITESTQVKSGVTTLYARWTKTAPKVQSRQTGNYQIVIPEDYKVLLYTSETTASVSKNALAQTGEYVVACTKMVKLSNGTVRYYGVFPKVSKTASYWFTYTDEMFVD